MMLAYLVTVAAIVFWPTAEVPSSSVAWMHARLLAFGMPGWVPASSVEFVSNMVLFVPLSLLGSLLWQRWSWVGWTVTGLFASMFIETTQMVLLAGRSPSVVDIVANTLGAYLGARLGQAAWLWLRDRPRPIPATQP